jgi:hypothetical protein
MVSLFIPGLRGQVFLSAGIAGNSFCYCWSEEMKHK